MPVRAAAQARKMQPTGPQLAPHRAVVAAARSASTMPPPSLAVAALRAGAIGERASPPASMRVPKAVPAARPTVAARAAERGLVDEKPEAHANEEHEWQALLARARRQQEEQNEETEWLALRARAAQAQQLAEEREWREHMAKVVESQRVPARRVHTVRALSAVVLWP